MTDSGSVFTPGTRVRVRPETRGTAFSGCAGCITKRYGATGFGDKRYDWLVRLDAHKGNRNVGDVAFAEYELEPLS